MKGIRLRGSSRPAPLALAWILLLPGAGLALDLGAEARLTLAGVGEASGLAAGAARDDFSVGGLSLRLMADQGGEAFSVQAHLLLDLVSSTPGAPPFAEPSRGAFRAWDLTASADWGERTVAVSELDRLLLAWEGPGVRVTAGRFALTWGEGWFFNPLDLFGAFAVDAVNRTWKAGVDGAVAVVPLGGFSEAEAAAVPRTGERPGSAALRVAFPAGKASLSLVAGEVAGDRVAGAGAAADLSGSKVYAQGLFTRPGDEKGFWQAVLGWERQTGPKTHLLAELFHDGWGTGEAGGYPARLSSPRFLSGRVPAVGRNELAAEGSLQLTPLLTGGAGGIVNLDDGSTLAHLAVSYSLSDLADLRGTLFAGLGARPKGGTPRSEWGAFPTRATLELVAAF